MPNPFDQYDAPDSGGGVATAPSNPFDQFDAPAGQQKQAPGNPFDEFDPKPSTTPATEQAYGSSGPTTAEAVGMEHAFAAAHPQLYPEIVGGLKAIGGMVPTSLEQARQMVKPPIQAAAGEENVQKSQQELVQEADQWGQAITGKLGPEAQGQTITGTAIQALPLLHLPFAESPFAKISKTAGEVSKLRQEQVAPVAAELKAAQEAQAVREQPPTVTSTTQSGTVAEPVAHPGIPPEEVLPPDQTNVPTDTEAANREIAQNGQEPPTGQEQAVAQPAAKVSQAITLEEIRLMREKADLQMQADISRRATGQEHPAITERIDAIDQELQDIVNSEFGQQPPRVIPEAGAAEPTEANLEIGQQERPLTKGELRISRKTGGEQQNAINQPETTGVPVRDQGGGLGESSPLRQQGQTADVPPQGDVGNSQPQQAPQTQGDLGISQARTEAELGLGSVEPGVGAPLGEGLAYGRDYINRGGDPRLPIRRAEGTGLVGRREIGIVHAELERLRGVRDQAERFAEANPNDPLAQARLDAADNAQRAWRKELQPVLTKAGETLREAYAESTVPDIGTYQGLANLMDEHFKGQHDITPADRTVLQKVSKAVDESRKETVKSVNDAVEATSRRAKKIMTPDELKADLAGVLKDAFKDCFL